MPETTFHLELTDARPGVWEAGLCRDGKPLRPMRLQWDAGTAPPRSLDGLAMAALPVAMRSGAGRLSVHGPITRGALWRMTDYARVWNQWSRGAVAATAIEADEILEGIRPSAGDRAATGAPTIDTEGAALGEAANAFATATVPATVSTPTSAYSIETLHTSTPASSIETLPAPAPAPATVHTPASANVSAPATPPASAPATVLAWSGSLASTHTLVRMIEERAAGAPKIDALMRIVGLRDGDGAGAGEMREAAALLGIRLHVMTVNALAEGWVDPLMGRGPWVAAAIHALGGEYGRAIVSRGGLLAAHRLFPRPGPCLPDLFSGDGMAILIDGGFVAPPRQAADVARHPALAKVVRATIRHRRRDERTLTKLAFAAAGRGRAGPGAAWAAMALSMGDASVSAEARATVEHWRARSPVKWILATRMWFNRGTVFARDHWRWAAAAMGIGKVHPR